MVLLKKSSEKKKKNDYKTLCGVLFILFIIIIIKVSTLLMNAKYTKMIQKG